MTHHREYRQAIAALASDRLEGPERQRLLEHLAACEGCASVFDTAREISAALERTGGRALAPHPDVKRLHAFARGNVTAERGAIAEHLAHCESCALEVAAWHAESSRGPRSVASARKPASGRRWLAAAGIFAAGVGAGILVRSVETVAPATPSLIVRGSERGAEALTRVYVGEGQPAIAIVILLQWLEPSAELGPLEARLLDLRGTVVWSTKIDAAQVVPFVETGAPFTLWIPAPELAAGRYELTVSRSVGSDPSPLIQRRFEVVRTLSGR